MAMLTFISLLVAPGIAFITTIVFCFLWKKVAIRHGILSAPNHRTLHLMSIPVGGGVAIFLGWTLAISTLLGFGIINLGVFIGLIVGSGLMSTLGLIDDIRNVSAKVKLFFQIIATLWCLYWFGEMLPFEALGFEVHLKWIAYLISGICILWMINLFNFMDGSDGMLASCTTFIGISMGSIVLFEGDYHNAALLYSMSAASLAFLTFNWPPASIFMGDTGSIFTGLLIPMLVISTVSAHIGLLWVWVIICGYVLTDTTTTLVLRLFYARPFLDAHRQHAYQSLVHRSGDHRRVNKIVLSIQVFWLLPIAVISYWLNDYGAIFTFLALAPIVVFSARYGVLYENS